MTAFTALRSTIREELQTDHPLPPLLDLTIDLFRKANIYYRTYKFALIHNKASKDPSKGHPAVYGAALHLIGDYTTIGSYAINVALVTKCTQDLLLEYRQLSKSYQKFWHTVQRKYPIYQHVEWKRENKSSYALLSPSLHLKMHIRMMDLTKQIRKITRCALEVLKGMFKLSMSLSDAYLLFNKDPQMRYEACTELVAKWDEYQSQLKEDGKRLAEEIEKGSSLADRILKKMGMKKDTTFIIDELKQTMKVAAEETKEVLDDAYNAAQDAIDAIFVNGKITSLQINLAEGKSAAPALPRGPFPPWGGQRMILDHSESSKSPAKRTKGLLNSFNESSFAKTSMSGLSHLTKSVHDIYQNEFKKEETISPFA